MSALTQRALCTSRSTKSSRNPFIPLISLISAPYITIECLLSQQFAISDICFAHLYDTPHTHKPQALRWLIQALGSPLVGYCHKIVTPKMSVQLPQWFCSVSCLLGNSRKSVERFVCDRNSRLLTETFLYLFLLPADFLIARTKLEWPTGTRPGESNRQYPQTEFSRVQRSTLRKKLIWIPKFENVA